MPDVIDDRQLAAYTRSELEMSQNWSGSEWRETIKESLNYLMFRQKGDEVPGRSEIQSGDVADMLDHVHAEVQPMYATADLFNVEPEGEADEDSARIEQEAVNWYWQDRSRGFEATDEAVQDALLSRNGYIKVWFEESHGLPYYETLVGDRLQIDAQLSTLGQENDVAIVEEVLVQDAQVETVEAIGPDGITPVYADVVIAPEIIQVEARIMPRHREVKICSPPPEDMFLSKDANSSNMQQPRFVGERRRMRRNGVAALGFEQKQVDRMPAVSMYDSDVRTARKRDYNTYSRYAAEPGGQMVDLYECYYILDTDGDGIPEMVKYFYSNNQEVMRWAPLNEDEEGESTREYVRFRPYASGSPLRVAHTHQGRGLFDKEQAIEDAKRKLIRQLLDNLASSNDADVAYGDGVRQSDLEQTEVGRNIYDPHGTVRYLQNPNTAGESLAALQYMDKVRRERGGSSIDVAGPNMPVGNVTAHTTERVMSAMEKLIAMYARNIAKTLLRDAGVLLHQQLALLPGKITFRSGSEWRETEPRYWVQRERISVQLGLSEGERLRKQAALRGVIERQDIDRDKGDFGVLVDYNGMYEARTDLADALGLENVQQYFVNPTSPEAQQALRAKQEQAAQQQAMAQQAQQQLIQAQIAMTTMQEQTKRMGDQLDSLEKQRDRLAKLTTEMTKLEVESGRDLPFGLAEGNETPEAIQ